MSTPPQQPRCVPEDDEEEKEGQGKTLKGGDKTQKVSSVSATSSSSQKDSELQEDAGKKTCPAGIVKRKRFWKQRPLVVRRVSQGEEKLGYYFIRIR